MHPGLRVDYSRKLTIVLVIVSKVSSVIWSACVFISQKRVLVDKHRQYAYICFTFVFGGLSKLYFDHDMRC